MTLPARIVRKTCATCAHFHRRDPALPWPLAGVSASVDGQCAAPKAGQPAAWRPWRAATDWCREHRRQEQSRAVVPA